MNINRLHSAALLLSIVAIPLMLRGEGVKSQEAPKGKPPRSQIGVLLMAHGGSREWNDQIMSIRQQVDAVMPAEVAFGMADHSALQGAADRLAARGATQIIAVPLLISSHSDVYEALAFLLGVREDAPKNLQDLASMGHKMPEMYGHSSPGETASTPIQSPVPLRMTTALDAHPVVADILADRAAAMSRNPEREVVILVAHGPVSDADNALWLQDMKSLAAQIERKKGFAAVEYVTLRDDAPESVKDHATAELRQDVEASLASNDRVLIVPLLLAYGGIDAGLRRRLDGLDHTMSSHALLPDSRIVTWVLDRVNQSESPARGAL